jgi:LysR family transcriptional regulator, hypochlorite-specific transcription factor HypT
VILLSSGGTLHLARSFDTHMAEALKAMVLAGHGLGWLPQNCAAREVSEGRLVAAGSARWSCELEVRLYRRADRGNEMVERIWNRLTSEA